MHFSRNAFVLSLLPVALAQYGGGDSTPSSKSSAPAPAPPASTAASSNSAIQTVTVGANGQLGFSPNTITAAVGSSIEFVFSPPTHSVVQSSFDSPCAPLANSTGFFSGAFTTASGTNANTFTITINDTSPIWFFCGFPTHCETGMAGVINAPSDGSATLPQYVAAAAKVSNPPTPSVVQGGIVGPAKAAVQASSSSSSSTSSAASTTPTKSAGIKGAEARGSTQWVVIAVTGLIAVGFGSMIV